MPYADKDAQKSNVSQSSTSASIGEKGGFEGGMKVVTKQSKAPASPTSLSAFSREDRARQ